MTFSAHLMRLKALTLCALGGCISLGAYAQRFAPTTAIPVTFTHSIQAGRARPGARIFAKTMQDVLLSNGGVMPAGSAVVGHVVQSEAFHANPVPYAPQIPSVLSIHFETLASNGSEVQVNLTARAIAGPVAAHEAAIPHYRDESDTTGTTVLIGGSSFSLLDNTVTSLNGDLDGYHRRQGVFARLLASRSHDSDSTIRCDATSAEQSVGIFSPDACGLYGLNTVSMTTNGTANETHGATNDVATFVLESTRRTVELYAGSAALLEVIER